MTTQTNTPQDSAFYTYSQDSEIVWSNDPNQRFYVVRAGEMRIHAMKNGHEVVIRYTDDLEDLGITNDKELGEWSAKEEMFEWVNNSWFDLYAEKRGWSDCVNHTLTDAIASATELLADPEAWDD